MLIIISQSFQVPQFSTFNFSSKFTYSDCAKYSDIAKIMEGTYKTDPPTIVKVEATDDDSSANGDIVYSLYYTQSESRKAFVIDRQTGVLTPSPHVVFDRETRPREDVTVKVGTKYKLQTTIGVQTVQLSSRI